MQAEKNNNSMGSSSCVLNAWHAYAKEVHSYLLHRSGDLDTADDLLQQVFLKSMRQGLGFCRLYNPRAWLFQVARNALVDHARLAKPQTELIEELTAHESDVCDPVDELQECLTAALASLSADDRRVVEQCDLQNIKQKDFADAHCLSLSAVKSRLLRARQRLREAVIRNCHVRFDEDGRVCCHSPEDFPTQIAPLVGLPVKE